MEFLVNLKAATSRVKIICYQNKGSHEKFLMMTLYSVKFQDVDLPQVYFSKKDFVTRVPPRIYKYLQKNVYLRKPIIFILS